MNERIIQLLKSQKEYCSGQAISRILGMSRTAVWKHIESLRLKGYHIDAVSRKGYLLVSCPDKLLPGEIKSGLKAKVFGRELFCHDCLSSTMDEAMKLGLSGKPEGTVICAETQTKGRGRRGRTWISEKGKGIYASVILRPKITVANVPQLTLLFAVSVCQALRQETGLEVSIKWPNDILIKDKKVAGILIELNAELDYVHFVIVGFGINISRRAIGLPALATSLSQEAKKDLSRVAIFKKILKTAEEDYFLFQKKGFAPIAQKWKSFSSTLGRKVKIEEASGSMQGVAMDLDNNGALIIKMNNGAKVRKFSGDVVYLREE